MWTCAFELPTRAIGECRAWSRRAVTAERQRHVAEPPDKAAPGLGAGRHRATQTTLTPAAIISR